MNMKSRILYPTLAVMAVCCFGGSDWLQFRGTDNSSVSDTTGLPITFDETTNVAWKVPLPGRGPSSPIVVGNQVVVTCSSGAKQDRLHVLSFNATSGKLQWHRQLWATGHVAYHPFGAIATPTPACDGQRIFAFYSSNDLACFDLRGNLQWFRGLAFDYPTARNDVGMASSPAVFANTVVVQMENQGESFAAGIDSATGETRWRIEREHDAIWASPTVLRGKTPEQDIVLLQGRSRLTAHDPDSGKELWDYEAPCHSTASAVAADGRIYLPAAGLHALQCAPGAKNVKPLWIEDRLRSGNASVMVHDDRVYTIKPPSILVCADAADGKILWELRLKGPQWASPVIADGRLYCVNHAGLVQVVELGEEGKLLGTSQLDGPILASPAVADGAIYFRSDKHLWKVMKD